MAIGNLPYIINTTLYQTFSYFNLYISVHSTLFSVVLQKILLVDCDTVNSDAVNCVQM